MVFRNHHTRFAVRPVGGETSSPAWRTRMIKDDVAFFQGAEVTIWELKMRVKIKSEARGG